MRRISLGSLAFSLVLSACGSNAGTDGGTADAAADVSGTDAAVDVLVDAAGTDAVGNELPQVDAVADSANDGADAGPGDTATNDVGPIDVPITPDVDNGCCQNDKACPANTLCIPGKDCVPLPKVGECWKDGDCKSGKCEGAFVCPCTADCSVGWLVGKCSDNAGTCCGGDKGGCLNSEQCVISKSQCKPQANIGGQCWSDVDCKIGTCQGASVCPCGAMCLVADKMGSCVDKPGGCCANGTSCAAGESCVHGPDKCKSQAELKAGQCWIDSDCAKGTGTCKGANVCPCGAMCLVADKAGTCTTQPDSCPTVDPNSFGLCAMVVGYVFDGKTCVTASGCGCGKQCNQVFATMVACQAACTF